jgi:8-oxo-dGTP pyrophosphatase MutT (NUDIX family)
MEILFLKRATNPTDRWSGDVAFPGGRQQQGETDKETAMRETLEEIGLDLHES